MQLKGLENLKNLQLKDRKKEFRSVVQQICSMF